jgi:hypothetical protein
VAAFPKNYLLQSAATTGKQSLRDYIENQNRMCSLSRQGKTVVGFGFSVFAAKLRFATNRGSRISESATFGKFGKSQTN